MQNLYFRVLLKPVVDRGGKTRYRKLRVLKVRGQREEELTLGRLLTFISNQFDKLKNHLSEGERFLIELPLDFLLSKTLIEGLKPEKINLLLGDPVSKFTKKHLFHTKQLLKEYLNTGLEVSFRHQTYMRYRYSFTPKEVSFICIPAEENLTFHRNCYFGVDSSETYERVKEKGELFCGKLFGDYETAAEITALSYLQTTIARALEILEREEVDISELERLIKTDPQLAVGIIKYANSPLIAPPSPIRDIKHAIVYLGLERLKEYLLMIMLNRLAAVDPEFQKIALRLGAAGLLLEEKGKREGLPLSGCQLFLGGLVLESAKIFQKPVEEILGMLSVPPDCPLPLEDKRFLELYNRLTPQEVEKAVLELRRLLEG